MKKYEKIFDELNDHPMKKIDELIKQAKELRRKHGVFQKQTKAENSSNESK